MISSGLSILRALYVLEEQTENKFLKETVVQVRKDVEAGLSLQARWNPTRRSSTPCSWR